LMGRAAKPKARARCGFTVPQFRGSGDALKAKGLAGDRPHITDNAMAKAIAGAFRWRETLESGEYATIREIAAAEKIN
jgi:hypothetical protein